MREILFRGKRKDNGEWVYGYYCRYGHTGKEKHYIIPAYASDLYAFEAIPETVGQYTGLTDKNDTKIFDGDILETVIDYDDTFGYPATMNFYLVVVWDEENFCWIFKNNGGPMLFNDLSWECSFKVGNIHDNPELLKERGE